MTVLGINRLRRACEILERDSEAKPAETTLLAGASEVWSAMFEMPSWPPPLGAKAEELQRSLFRYGPIRMTVEQMTESERLELRRELKEFCDFAEQLERQPEPAESNEAMADLVT